MKLAQYGSQWRCVGQIGLIQWKLSILLVHSFIYFVMNTFMSVISLPLKQNLTLQDVNVFL